VKIRVWEYDVPAPVRSEFERVYGSDGDWAQLFASSDGFHGTELFRSVRDPGRYVTIDRFIDDDAWKAFMSQHGEAYRLLGDATEGLTSAQRELT
jgi:heme-degrading monooxygenase HmoA